MSTSQYLPDIKFHSRAMMFIDGENLTIRYKNIIAKESPKPHVTYLEDIYVWSNYANIRPNKNCEVIRKYFYTAVPGDDPKIYQVEDDLKKLGIESPQVFKKAKDKPSKRVDITLSTDMLSHAHKGNYDIAILVAGDDDYVPLVRAVKAEGCRVVLWFFEKEGEGLSRNLKMESDWFFDISWFLLKDENEIKKHLL